MARPLEVRYAEWLREHGPEIADQKREEVRARQRRYSKVFYAENAPKVRGWVVGRILDKQERLAGRPRATLCEACGSPEVHRRQKLLSFDHCHKYGHFRGWLCARCNWALGIARDDPDVLRKLADYLDRDRAMNWPKPNPIGA